MEEPGFRVLLTEAGDRTREAVRAVRTVTGLSLWNSRLLLAGAPVEVEWSGRCAAAEEAVRVLEDAGARAVLLCDCCGRTVRRGAFPVDRCRTGGSWFLEACWAGEPPAVG
ncbi:ribosomal protein L7/L12 [Streptomyces sp. cmx-4-9]|uniref:ribosomal protein L7/L12 n=1 Tax=Streptomyces sp. cmx-4-9 TaxID=2790941 RepID=UPI003980A2A8